MSIPEHAVPVLFGQGRQADALYLSLWRDAPITYTPSDKLDFHWYVDHYETVLGRDPSGKLFQRAARLVLTNQIYPVEVMLTTSDYELEHRQVQPGDRILQRIRVFRLGSRPLAEVLTMNEVTDVVKEERRAGFTYMTTQIHDEIGEWSPVVEWRENGEVVLVIDVVSRCRPGASELVRRFSRRMALRAHKLSIQNMRAQLHGVMRGPQKPTFPADLLPVALLGTAFLLLIGATIGYNRKGRP